MRKISADYIIPVSSPPIKNGVIIMNDGGQILAIDDRKNFDEPELEIYRGMICPGFINAHCHLELSYMRGKITEHTGFVGFISEFLKKRNDADEHVQQAIADAENEMIRNGIVGIGDISNAATSFHQKSKRKILYHTFVECFGLSAEKADEFLDQSKKVFHEARRLELAASITPHAPYSISDELFEMIFSFTENHPPVFSYHNQESEDENKLYRDGTGSFLNFYRQLSSGNSSDHFSFHEKRKAESSVKAHLHFFPKDKKILFVHDTFTSAEDVDFVMNHRPNAYWCFCPNANLYIENALPQFQNFLSCNDRICIGTDSYASNHQVSILEEMKTIQQHDHTITTLQLIQWATVNGAAFFGWDELGSLEAGKKPGLNLISETQGDLLPFSRQSTVTKLI